MREMGKKEAEIEYKMMLNTKMDEYEDSLKNIKEQYEQLIMEKDAQKNQFMNEANSYTTTKK